MDKPRNKKSRVTGSDFIIQEADVDDDDDEGISLLLCFFLCGQKYLFI